MKTISNSVIVNISMPPEFLEELDRWAKLTYQGRSSFIREAVLEYMGKRNLDKGIKLSHN